MKTKHIALLIVLLLSGCIQSCAPTTPQETQNQMYNSVWNPQAVGGSFSVRRGGQVAAPVGRYYGASDFFNNN